MMPDFLSKQNVLVLEKIRKINPNTKGEKMNKILQIIIIVIIAIAVAVGSFAVFQFINLKKQELASIKKYQCASSSTYTVKDGNATVSYPVKDLYEKCIKEKSI
jgi:flagellar basal body-associated protein FliL